MGWETEVQSQDESYQRLEKKKKKKKYLIPPYFTLSILRNISMVKWSNPLKGIALSLILQCSSYRKGSFQVALDYSRQLDFYDATIRPSLCGCTYLGTMMHIGARMSIRVYMHLVVSVSI